MAITSSSSPCLVSEADGPNGSRLAALSPSSGGVSEVPGNLSAGAEKFADDIS